MRTERPATHDYSSLRATQLQREILRVASRQHQLITSAELGELGLPAERVSYRLRTGRLFQMWKGVHSVAPPPHPPARWLLAATLACGKSAVASDWSAAWLFGMATKLVRPIHISSARGSGRRRRGIVVHRYEIEPKDITRRHGTPCTTPARTILDLAAGVERERLEEILLEAHSRRIVNVRRLYELADGHAGRRGIRNLHAVLGQGLSLTRSRAEIRFKQACRLHRLPEPRVNAKIRVEGSVFEVDFIWDEHRLAIELDGYAFHGSRTRSNSDRDRDQLLSIAGWRIVRFTRDQLIEDPGEVARRVDALLVRPASS